MIFLEISLFWFLQELENKYDALRDKVLAGVLMSQLGAAEWGRLSEQERQKKLTEMKLLEKKLRKEGKICVVCVGLKSEQFGWSVSCWMEFRF